MADRRVGIRPQTARAEPGTVSICFVAAALEAVRARKMNVDELLLRVGLSPTLLQSPHARVSANTMENCGV